MRGRQHDHLVRARRPGAVADDRVLVRDDAHAATRACRARPRRRGRPRAASRPRARGRTGSSRGGARERLGRATGVAGVPRARARRSRAGRSARRRAVPAWGQGRRLAARSLEPWPVRFVIIGGGPAGNTAATVAASLGAEVTMIERDIVGGAAHLWDCIPSKAMVATGNELAELDARARRWGSRPTGCLDVDALRDRDRGDGGDAARRRHEPARVAGRAPDPRHRPAHGRVHGRGRRPTTGIEEIEADAILLATGSRPRVPDWADDRRRAHPHDPPGLPAARDPRSSRRDRFRASPGVEFTHMFSALGSQVTLIVSRQQVLPHEGPRGRGGARERVPPAGRASC